MSIEPVETSRLDGEIIPLDLAVKAMRDSGYKNTAYALAELIDNSVQAGADSVEVICIEEKQQIKERTRRRIQAIAILDNGEGMSPEILRLALQFGNGTHLTDRKGIGRFGMGLPNSSISQCRRLEVWTWQNGPDNAMYTYLDINQIENRKMFVVPLPSHTPLPREWRVRSEIIETTGTLVLWSDFDDHRLSWRGAKATLKNTESLIGRMYRKFIDSGLLSIRLLAFQAGDADPDINEPVLVNDPLYLMCQSSTPQPFNTKPMFQSLSKEDEQFFIDYAGECHSVYVRVSWAHEDTIPDDRSDRGSKNYGKHAAKNIGLSVVREGRELELDPSWALGYDPVERWWGVEVEFPSALDELFGVTNNKQKATNFSRMVQFDWKSEADSGESMSEFLHRIQSEGDPRALLMPIADHIRKQLQEVRKRLKQQTASIRTNPMRHDNPKVEDYVTSKFNERAQKGHLIDSDTEVFTKNHRDKLVDDLRDDKGYPIKVAKAIADATLIRKRKVVFVTKAMDGYAFFNIEHKQGGLTEIVFNTNHPFYEKLKESLDRKLDDGSDADLIDRIHKAADTLEILFAAWGRYEMEEVGQQDQLFEIRQEWGKMARFFLSEWENE